jgi:hypothetical protein
MKGLARKFKHIIVDPALLRCGYELWPAEPEWRSRPVSRREAEKLLTSSAEAIWGAVGAKLGVDNERIRREVEAFFACISSCPVVQNHGGSGFNGGLLLFVIARVQDPEVIIESGVFRGFTTWIMRQACPAAKIYCFDLTFRSLMYRDSKAVYVQRDWSGFDFASGDLRKSLCFFDDHVDQWRRIEEAKARKADCIVFDDSFPSHKIHCELSLAVPSAAFLLEELLTDDSKIEWRNVGGNFDYHFDTARAIKVKGFCRSIVQLPSLFDQTGYRPASMTLVEMK